MKNFKRLESGSYLNFDLIAEIAVFPWHLEELGADKEEWIIAYWYADENAEMEQIPGVYDTKKEAQEELDKLMMGK